MRFCGSLRTLHHARIDPLEMSYLLGIVGGCAAAMLILVCLCIYAVRSRKCCFKGTHAYEHTMPLVLGLMYTVPV